MTPGKTGCSEPEKITSMVVPENQKNVKLVDEIGWLKQYIDDANEKASTRRLDVGEVAMLDAQESKMAAYYASDNHKETVQLIDDLCELIGIETPSERSIDLYLEALEGVPACLVLLARTRLLQSYHYRQLPLPGDVVKVVSDEIAVLCELNAKLRVIRMKQITRTREER